jgi:hypothetical protein
LIAFPVEPQYAVDQNWWRELTGVEKESSTQKKHERNDEGIFDGSAFSLSVDVLRVQWTAAARLDLENLPDAPPLLGSFLERKAWFSGLMGRWLATCPKIRRLAFVAFLIQPVETREEGYRLLDRYLRSVEVDPRSSDLLYRINWRTRATTVPDLEINRLCTWSVPRYTLQMVAQAGAGLPQSVQGGVLGCGVEMDINTVPEPPERILPHETLPQLFEELVSLGTEIATKGDVRP